MSHVGEFHLGIGDSPVKGTDDPKENRMLFKSNKKSKSRPKKQEAKNVDDKGVQKLATLAAQGGALRGGFGAQDPESQAIKATRRLRKSREAQLEESQQLGPRPLPTLPAQRSVDEALDAQPRITPRGTGRFREFGGQRAFGVKPEPSVQATPDFSGIGGGGRFRAEGGARAARLTPPTAPFATPITEADEDAQTAAAVRRVAQVNQAVSGQPTQAQAGAAEGVSQLIATAKERSTTSGEPDPKKRAFFKSIFKKLTGKRARNIIGTAIETGARSAQAALELPTGGNVLAGALGALTGTAGTIAAERERRIAAEERELQGFTSIVQAARVAEIKAPKNKDDEKKLMGQGFIKRRVGNQDFLLRFKKLSDRDILSSGGGAAVSSLLSSQQTQRQNMLKTLESDESTRSEKEAARKAIPVLDANIEKIGGLIAQGFGIQLARPTPLAQEAEVSRGFFGMGSPRLEMGEQRAASAIALDRLNQDPNFQNMVASNPQRALELLRALTAQIEEEARAGRVIPPVAQ